MLTSSLKLIQRKLSFKWCQYLFILLVFIYFYIYFFPGDWLYYVM